MSGYCPECGNVICFCDEIKRAERPHLGQKMSDLRKTAEMALEALRNTEVVHMEQLNAMYALQEALAQPVDAVNMSQECVETTKKCKCEWRGLSQKELLNLWVAGIPRMSRERYIQIAQQVEQYLKEKNA